MGLSEKMKKYLQVTMLMLGNAASKQNFRDRQPLQQRREDVINAWRLHEEPVVEIHGGGTTSFSSRERLKSSARPLFLFLGKLAPWRSLPARRCPLPGRNGFASGSFGSFAHATAASSTRTHCPSTFAPGSSLLASSALRRCSRILLLEPLLLLLPRPLLCIHLGCCFQWHLFN